MPLSFTLQGGASVAIQRMDERKDDVRLLCGIRHEPAHAYGLAPLHCDQHGLIDRRLPREQDGLRAMTSYISSALPRRLPSAAGPVLTATGVVHCVAKANAPDSDIGQGSLRGGVGAKPLGLVLCALLVGEGRRWVSRVVHDDV
ncbi:hypothetical protein D9619_008896 [Psilocybe cf. subviscida]|uniref:Uncharacterized protein n=1 Tax=Psilocybe cf. subviscida TaxID=2480587 RepID=A0A8H5BBG1_9AGAR|nr:hypothetical protein D9619_008896 [Psilocybe cf. subviscida]